MRSLLAAVALVLALAAPAQAGWKVDRATAIAAVVWNHPCADHVTLTWKPLPDAHAEEATVDQCALAFDSRYPLAWPVFCTVVIHGYGHLARYRDPLNPSDPLHSHDPHSVMYASPTFVEQSGRTTDGREVPTEWLGTDRRCARNGRPYLQAHGGGTLGARGI